jgi:uncharacterized membrane protein YkvA (DUF1232 family)
LIESRESNKQSLWSRLREKARALKRETFAVYFACRDPRVPWGAKVIAACVVAYAFSPIDLIPDFVPILGYLDDLLLVPLGIALVIKMVPAAVMDDCRIQAQEALAAGSKKPKNWIAASLIILLWLLVAGFAAIQIWRIFEKGR